REPRLSVEHARDRREDDIAPVKVHRALVEVREAEKQRGDQQCALCANAALEQIEQESAEEKFFRQGDEEQGEEPAGSEWRGPAVFDAYGETGVQSRGRERRECSKGTRGAQSRSPVFSDGDRNRCCRSAEAQDNRKARHRPGGASITRSALQQATRDRTNEDRPGYRAAQARTSRSTPADSLQRRREVMPQPAQRQTFRKTQTRARDRRRDMRPSAGGASRCGRRVLSNARGASPRTRIRKPSKARATRTR